MTQTLERPRLTFSVGKRYHLRSGAIIRLTKITWVMGEFFFLDGDIVLSPVGESFDDMPKPPRLFWGPDGRHSYGHNDRGEDIPHELDIVSPA